LHVLPNLGAVTLLQHELIDHEAILGIIEVVAA
jgi:hypothetical protein